jgi:hypothetical protein
MRLNFALILLLLFSGGCDSNDVDTRVFHPWGVDNAKQFKARTDQYQHVLVASVSESHWEDRGPHKLTPYHFKATVVRSYKGDWKVADEIKFVHYVDAAAPANIPSGARDDTLMFVFTNERTNAEISVDTGDFGMYNSLYAPALEYAFPGAK